jgi:hypothetical protein
MFNVTIDLGVPGKQPIVIDEADNADVFIALRNASTRRSANSTPSPKAHGTRPSASAPAQTGTQQRRLDRHRDRAHR